MKRSRCRSVSFWTSCTVALSLFALGASAGARDLGPRTRVSVVDSRGAVIGSIGIASCESGGCGPTLFVVRRENGISFQLAFDPETGFIPTTDDLVFESTDCTGSPLVRNAPATADERVMSPTIVREPGCEDAPRIVAHYPLVGSRVITIGSTRADYSCSPPTRCAANRGTALGDGLCCLPCTGRCRSSVAEAGILNLSEFTPPFILETR